MDRPWPGAHDTPSDLDTWLAPFLDVFGRKTRRTWAPLYLRGLLGPGERKSRKRCSEAVLPRGSDAAT